MKKNLAFSCLSVVAIWIAWLIAYVCIRNDYIFPSFWDVIKEMGKQFVSAVFWTAFLHTLLRTLVSFAVSLVLGIVLALLSEFFGWIRAFIAPVVTALRTLPTMAVILILLIWTNPLVAPAVVTVLVLFPAVYAASIAAFDGIGGEYESLCQAYGVSKINRAFKMYLPLSIPALLTQSGAIASMGLKVTVSAEVLSSTFKSLGGMMHEAQAFLNVSALFALTILTVLTGFLIEGVCYLLKKYAVRWRV